MQALRNAWLVRASRRWAAGKGQKSPNGSSFLTGMDASASAAGGKVRQGSAGEGDQKGAGQEAVERSGSHAIKETDDLAADERIEDVASEDKWQMVLAFLEQVCPFFEACMVCTHLGMPEEHAHQKGRKNKNPA